MQGAIICRSVWSFMAITNICHLTDRAAWSALVFIVGIKTQSISPLLEQAYQQVNTLQLNPSDRGYNVRANSSPSASHKSNIPRNTAYLGPGTNIINTLQHVNTNFNSILVWLYRTEKYVNVGARETELHQKQKRFQRKVCFKRNGHLSSRSRWGGQNTAQKSSFKLHWIQ